MLRIKGREHKSNPEWPTMNRLSATVFTSVVLAVSFLFLGCPEAKSGESSTAQQLLTGPGVFFVATNGNDQWSGHLPEPNKSKTDGPVGRPQRALELSRGAAKGPRMIYLRAGTYFLKEPLVLKPEDSGLTLASFPAEKAQISGGRMVNVWRGDTINGKSLWASDLPEAGQGKWSFQELWVNGQRATRARHPNSGYLPIAALPDKASDWTQGQSRFTFRERDVKQWATATNAEVVAMTRWVESRLPILSIDEKQRQISFSKRSVFELSAGDLYYVEGALELLDQPGEWYLDPASGTLYYIPRPGENIQQVEAVAPVLTQVVRLEGQPQSGQFIENVHFRGLAFGHTEWYFPGGFHAGKNKPEISPAPKPEVGGFGQAAIGVPGAVWGEGVRHSSFENCSFHHIGNYALELARGCQRNRISECTFSDLGGGGIKIGETSIREKTEEQARSNEISQCRIGDGGKLFHSAIGVWIGQSPDNRIANCEIHDFFYTGISIGWTWGYGPALASNNVVEFNHVHHIGVKSDGDGPILSDMAGIYTLGKQPGTRIINNLWHDMAATRYGGWGICFDEGSSGILAKSNVVSRTTHGGFHQHYGETNVVQNNIFAFGRDHQIQRSRAEPHDSFTFETNIVYFDSGKLLDGAWSDDKFEMDWNEYFDARPIASQETIRFGKNTFEEWRARGHDQHSIMADPLFVAPRQDDFRLRSGSPALKLGFQPIDLSNVGPRQK